MESKTIKTRFAPSPTGLLHLGNIRTALFNFLQARRMGGVFLLRVEDTDATRGHEQYAAALMQDLRWLGLVWDEGPGADHGHGPYAQSERGPIYKKYFSVLEAKDQAYPCFCSEHELAIMRKTQIAAARPPRYSGRCRDLSADDVAARFAKGESATLRFRVAENEKVEFHDLVRGPQVFATDDIGDFVIRRSDGTSAFFFCNAIDDAVMGVTLVVRGEDHLSNTPRQLLLLHALGLAEPQYAHIALVTGADGAPLSKRTGSKSVQGLRTSGFLPVAINNYLARLGHSYEDNRLQSLEALAANFSVERLHRAPSRYDEVQLLHWQHEAIRYIPASELWEWMGEQVHALIAADKREAFIDTVRGNLTFPQDALTWARIIFTDQWDLPHGASTIASQAVAGFFQQALLALETHDGDFKALSEQLKQTSGAKGKALFQPLRAALTGELDGPEMAKLLPLMGVPRARARLEKFI